HNLYRLGYQDQALSRGEQAVLWGRTLRHSHSLLYALAHTASLFIGIEEMQPAFDALEEATAIATQQGFPFWLAYCTMLRGYVLVTRGEAAKGLALARKGHEEMKATGAWSSQTIGLSLLAKCSERAELPEEAFALLTRALEIAERTNERFYL